jgi:hypothetical protein
VKKVLFLLPKDLFYTKQQRFWILSSVAEAYIWGSWLLYGCLTDFNSDPLSGNPDIVASQIMAKQYISKETGLLPYSLLQDKSPDIYI